MAALFEHVRRAAGLAAVALSAENCIFFLIVVSVILGGGGVGYAWFNLTVQLVAIALLAVHRERVFGFVWNAPRPLVALVLATMALPLLQLIPLPPALWTLLPGRDLAEQALDLVEAADTWQPISVDSNRTAVAFLGLLPAFAIVVLGWDLEPAGRERMRQAIIAAALICVAMGAVQLATGNRLGNWYSGGQPDVLYGSFANRNSTGLFLVIALLAVLGAPDGRRVRFGSLPARITLGVIFAICVFLTQSRSSVALLLVPLALVGWRFVSARREAGPPRGGKGYIPVVIAALLVAGASYVAVTTYRIQQTVERFESFDGPRLAVWDDSRAVAGRYWPVGSGTGTFDEVFQVDESLEHVDPTRPGRAHNDYLELMIESGIFGLLLAGAWAAWLSRSALTTPSGPLRTQGQVVAGFALLVLALQSLVDYPLRNQTLLCVAALMLVLAIGRGPVGRTAVTASGEAPAV